MSREDIASKIEYELENLKIAIEDLEDIQNEVSDLNHIPINEVKKETKKIVNELEKVMDDIEKVSTIIINKIVAHYK
jgi:predicted transcriptional regulator